MANDRASSRIMSFARLRTPTSPNQMPQAPAPLTLGGSPSTLYTSAGRNKVGLDEPRGFGGGREMFADHSKAG